MKLTAKHLGLLFVLLLGVTHADAPADTSVAALVADTNSTPFAGEAITAHASKAASNEAVLGEVIKQPTSTAMEEIKANLTEVKTALKDSFQAVAVVASGIVDVAGSVLGVASGTVNFAIAVAKTTWFAGMVLYIAASALVEFSQATFASK